VPNTLESSKKLIRALALAVIATTPAHPAFAQAIRVPGTSVALAPPEGFSLAQRYPGFERADARASIMVTEVPVAAVDMMRSMTTPALASKGLILLSTRDAVIKDNPARLLHVRQKAAGDEVVKWMLIAGDSETSIMIVATFVEGVSPGIGDAIWQSLLTASWASAAPPRPLEGLP